MAFLTSDEIADIAIICAVFALLVMISPVSAVDYHWSDGVLYTSHGGSSPGSPYPPDVPNALWVHYGVDRVCGDSSTDGEYLYYVYANVPNNGWTGQSWLHLTPTNCFTPDVDGKYMVFSPLSNGPWANGKSMGYFYMSSSLPGWLNQSGAGLLNVDYTVDKTSGTQYSPVTVQFTDSTAGFPSSWNWTIGNQSYSTRNVSVYFADSGSYSVTHCASTGTKDDCAYGSYVVNSWSVPVAAFSCSPVNATPPVSVTCTDASTNTPTSWSWQLDSFGVSMSPGGSYGAGIYTAVNSTQNPVFYMTGSGTVDVRLTATNPAGSSQEYKPAYITISGEVPTPTPTPAIPWPNQTGICRGSAISLGSGATRAHAEHYQLTDPYGDTFSGNYPAGTANYITGYPFFTALIGQYVYQEYSTIDSTLEWQQSYVTQDCTGLTPTPMITAVTTVPTYTTYVIPVVTITPFNYVGATSNTSVNYGITLPTSINMPTLPSSLPPVPASLNETNFYNLTCSGSSPLIPIFCPITTYIRFLLQSFNSAFMFLVWVPFGFIATVLGYLTLALSSFTGAITLWSTGSSILAGIMWNIFQAIPAKALNALTVPLLGEFLKEMIDWPEDLQ